MIFLPSLEFSAAIYYKTFLFFNGNKCKISRALNVTTDFWISQFLTSVNDCSDYINLSVACETDQKALQFQFLFDDESIPVRNHLNLKCTSNSAQLGNTQLL